MTATDIAAFVGAALSIWNVWARRARFKVVQPSLSLRLRSSKGTAEQHIEGMFDLVRTSGDKDCYLMEWEFKPNKSDLDRFSELKDLSIKYQEPEPRQLKPNLAVHIGVSQPLPPRIEDLVPQLKDAPTPLVQRKWPELIKEKAEMGTLFHVVKKTKITVDELVHGSPQRFELRQFELRWKDGEGNWHTYHHPPPLWQRGRDKFWG